MPILFLVSLDCCFIMGVFVNIDEVALLDDKWEPHEANRSEARIDGEDEEKEDGVRFIFVNIDEVTRSGWIGSCFWEKLL